MTMHDRIDDLAPVAAFGGLAPAEQAELDAHAAGCADCAAQLREARDFHAWMSGAVTPDRAPAGLEDRIVARLGAPRRRLGGGRLLRWAAGLVAVAGLVLIGGRFSSARDLPMADATEPSFAVEHLWAENGRGVNGGESLKRLEMGAQEHERGFEIYPPGAQRMRLGVDKSGGLVTKLEADLQVMNRQNEVQLAQLQETRRQLGELQHGVEDSSGRNAQGEQAGLAVEHRAKLGRLEDKASETLSRGGATFSLVEPAEPAAVVPLPTQSTQKLVRNGSLAIEVLSYDETHGKLVVLVTEEKGYVADASSEKLKNGKTRATVVLRVPSERFDAVVAKLRALGTVINQSVTVEDLTKAYADLEVRLAAKSAFLERLRKLLAEGKGGVKELLEVEVQIGATIAEIDQMKGELRFADNRIALSTLTLEIAEKDLGRPFEVVETLRAAIGLAAADVDGVHAAAQKVFTDAGGRVADAAVSRGIDGSARGTLKGRVDAAKFPAVREALRKLGHVTADTVDRRKTGQGGDPRADAPVRVEEAIVDVTVASPAEHVARKGAVTVESTGVESAYAAARKAVEAAGGRITEGQLIRKPEGLRAILRARVDADRYDATIEAFRALGKAKEQASAQSLPPAGTFVKEVGELELLLESPPALIGEEQGLGKVIRDTFKGSVAGVLWSLEKLFVGASLALPWALLGLAGWLIWRRYRKAKAA